MILFILNASNTFYDGSLELLIAIIKNEGCKN